MRRDQSAYLLDMLEAARDAVRFAEGLSFADFEDNRQLQRAVFNAVQEIGEAARHVNPAVKAGRPDVPWNEIVGMRNRLVHAYFGVDLGVVWDTVQTDLPILISQLESMISSGLREAPDID